MDSQTLNLYIGIIGVSVAIIVPLAIYYFQRKKKILAYEEIQNLSVVNIKKDFKDKMEIKYDGKVIDNLFVSTATLKNKGTLPIKISEILKPIEIVFDKKILDCSVIEVNPKGIEVTLNPNSEDNSINCEFNLLNPRDYFTLQFISLERLSTPIVISRIEGLSKVDILSNDKKDGIAKRKSSILEVGISISAFCLILLQLLGVIILTFENFVLLLVLIIFTLAFTLEIIYKLNKL
ncbi:hypothetical protein [Methanosarcina sp. WH1]|uniref:hypothetical protein n=1 Tax=Methanosarcina sp. WH1 TaxID=1434102 RepID=UPI0006156369|nr:hypothetical protein [Methanosarcina sp. WH1]AKB22314.1 hypothetical protein MSWH1_2043 [Methanosarcina sp. WH1]